MRSWRWLWLLCLLAANAHAFYPPRAAVVLVAGEGSAGFEDGEFNQAKFNSINAILLDEAKGCLLVAESANAALRAVDLNHHNRVSTILSCQQLTQGKAEISEPYYMSWGETHDIVYLSDRGSHQIKKINLAQRAVAAVYGSTVPGYSDGPISLARFFQPQGLCLLKDDLLLVADYGNDALRMIDLRNGKIATLYKHSDSRQIQFVFTNPADGTVFFTRVGVPGIWALRTKTNERLRQDHLGQARADARMTLLGIDACAQEMQTVGNVMTTMTLVKNRLFYACRERHANRIVARIGQLNIFRLQDPPEMMDWSVWQPMVPAADGSSREAFQQDRLFDLATGLAMDEPHNRIFIADAANHRILACPTRIWNQAGKEQFYPAAKPDPQVFRIIFYSNSIGIRVADAEDAMAQRRLHAWALSSRLEYWLNLFALMDGREQRFEVIVAGQQANFGQAVIARMQQTRGMLDQYQADMVFYAFSALDVAYDSFECLFKPPQDSGVDWEKDSEFLLQPVKQRALHPDGQDLLEYIEKYPDRIGALAWIEQGELQLNHAKLTEALQNPQNQALLVDLACRRLNQYMVWFNQRNQSRPRKTAMVLALIPVPANLSVTEILSSQRWGTGKLISNFLKPALQRWSQGRGITFFDSVDLAKIMEPTLFPLFNREKEDHYSQKAADFVAFLLADQLWKERFK